MVFVGFALGLHVSRQHFDFVLDLLACPAAEQLAKFGVSQVHIGKFSIGLFWFFWFGLFRNTLGFLLFFARALSLVY